MSKNVNGNMLFVNITSVNTWVYDDITSLDMLEQCLSCSMEEFIDALLYKKLPVFNRIDDGFYIPKEKQSVYLVDCYNGIRTIDEADHRTIEIKMLGGVCDGEYGFGYKLTLNSLVTDPLPPNAHDLLNSVIDFEVFEK